VIWRVVPARYARLLRGSFAQAKILRRGFQVFVSIRCIPERVRGRASRRRPVDAFAMPVAMLVKFLGFARLPGISFRRRCSHDDHADRRFVFSPVPSIRRPRFLHHVQGRKLWLRRRQCLTRDLLRAAISPRSVNTQEERLMTLHRASGWDQSVSNDPQSTGWDDCFAAHFITMGDHVRNFGLAECHVLDHISHLFLVSMTTFPKGPAPIRPPPVDKSPTRGLYTIHSFLLWL